MKTDKLLAIIEEKITRSISTIQNEISANEQNYGLKSGDSYTLGKVSIMKTAQFLWAISESNAYTQTTDLRYSLTQFLLSSINNTKYTNHWNRTFNVIFSLLALSHQNVDIRSNEYVGLVNKLIAAQQNGSWQYNINPQRQTKGSVRATAFAIHALTTIIEKVGTNNAPFNQISHKIEDGIKWLFSVTSPEGLWGKKTKFHSDIYNTAEQFEAGIEINNWCVFSICYYMNTNRNYTLSESNKTKLNNAMKYLSSLDIQQLSNTVEIEPEEYYFGTVLKKHDYTSTGIVATILATIEYQKLVSDKRVINLNLRNLIYQSTGKFLTEEKNGYWLDKNSNDYTHLWTICYALVALTSIDHYIKQDKSFLRNFVNIITSKISRSVNKIFKSKIILSIIVMGIVVIVASIITKKFPDALSSYWTNFLLFLGILISAVGTIIGLVKK